MNDALLSADTPATEDNIASESAGNVETTNTNTEEFSYVPEKFMVDGQPDFQKLSESYANLEKKQGSGSNAPENTDGYTFDFQEEGTFDAEGLNEFKELSMELGISTDQFGKLMGMYENRMLEVAKAFNPDPKEALTETWGSDYDDNIKSAQRAFNSLPDQFDPDVLGRNPDVLQILSYFGAQMSEDNPKGMQGSSGSLSTEQVKEMMGSTDYSNNNSDTYKSVEQWFQNGNTL